MKSEPLRLLPSTGIPPSVDPPAVVGEAWDLGIVSYYADGVPFPAVCVDLAYELGVSVAVPPGLEEKLVSVVFEDTQGEEAFQALARQIEYRAFYSGGVVRFEKGSGGDIAVFRPGYESVDDAAEAARAIAGESAKVVKLGDRIAVVADRDAVMRIEGLSDFLKVGPDGWAIEFRLYECTDVVLRRAGIEYEAGGSLRFEGSVGHEGGTLRGSRAALLLEAVADFAAQDTSSEVLTEGVAYLVEGRDVVIQSGDVVPIPQRTVSPEGTVSTNGYDFVRTGLNLNLRGQRVPNGLLLTINPEVSEVTGFVEEAPIVSTRRIESAAVVDSGEWIVLVGLGASRDVESRDASGLPLGRRTRDGRFSSVVIGIRATRVTASNLPDEKTILGGG